MSAAVGAGCDFCAGTGLVGSDGRTPWEWRPGMAVEKAQLILHATSVPLPCPFCVAP